MAIRLSGLTSGMDTESLVSALVSGYRTKVENYTKAQTKLSWKQEEWTEINKKMKSLHSSLSNLRFSTAYQSMKATASDSTKAAVSASGSAVTGVHTLRIKSLAAASYLTGDKISLPEGSDGSLTAGTKLSDLGYNDKDGSKISVTYNNKTTDIDVNADMTIGNLVSKLKETGLKANFDEANGRIFVSSPKSGKDYDFSLSESEADGRSALDILRLNESAGANKIKGADAEIILDNATYTNNSNSFSINGLNINAQAVTTSDVSVTVDTDIDGLYDKIKDFLSQYNSIVNDLTTRYNAASAKGYDPLTDEQKKNMSDTEVEKWETKIKDSLLRNDDSLGSILDTMTNSMSASYTINGKKYSLTSFGIHTLGFLNASKNEQNAYHIDGDEDDSSTSTSTDKLKEALTRDPDSVVEFMKQLTGGLYSALDKKMQSSKVRSKYSVYNDKEMASEYSEYTKLIKEWNTRLTDMEDSYYKKFSNMESALTKLNSNSSSLTHMLG
jgi:flagellar hook-associated protein 2